MDRLNPLNDFLFKKLFGDENDRELLMGLLNAIIQADIVNLTIENEKLKRLFIEGKLGILDIKAKTSTGEKINIEVQLINQKNMVPRTLFYWSKLFVEGFEAGSHYNSLKKTVTINILGFKMAELRYEHFHSIYKLQEAHSKSILTDLLEIHFIEFPKFEEITYDLNIPLHRWLLFLTEDISENLLREVTSMDVILNKAEEKLLRLSADPDTRREYELREKALSDERSRLDDARECGIVEGMETGIIKVVKSLLATGMPLYKAAKHTPYTVEELKQMLEKNDSGA
ncbi:Rpn family recombination-promoting nuclease/putative transposase [Neobacillus novalis]|uniref:Rpn family recombination-promoting nuclease/putative transposase n=1 Tax=Neobacillus novalis TaxID=220687 RepID=A0AA95SAS6_9BACI|nr:Rpn family recombination-promoting nuclease/putative transposase [Neobacillus novalis]WHY86112.1 Rpn family recombination-promoting nuclease/putative transposase [Neobacillus novalis]